MYKYEWVKLSNYTQQILSGVYAYSLRLLSVSVYIRSVVLTLVRKASLSSQKICKAACRPCHLHLLFNHFWLSLKESYTGIILEPMATRGMAWRKWRTCCLTAIFIHHTHKCLLAEGQLEILPPATKSMACYRTIHLVNTRSSDELQANTNQKTVRSCIDNILLAVLVMHTGSLYQTIFMSNGKWIAWTYSLLDLCFIFWKMTASSMLFKKAFIINTYFCIIFVSGFQYICVNWEPSFHPLPHPEIFSPLVFQNLELIQTQCRSFPKHWKQIKVMYKGGSPNKILYFQEGDRSGQNSWAAESNKPFSWLLWGGW